MSGDGHRPAGCTFTHNGAGDITLDDRGAGNTVTIAIGADGRPQTIAVAGTGATTVTYKHNAFGERVSRVEGANTTHFHYDQDGRLIAESDGTGAVIREYLWLGPKPLGLVVGPAASPTLYFVHADHLERVQKITDASQAIVWDSQFTPYGRTHAIAGTVQNPLRFPGQWADPAASYFYNYMRDYDPTLARYLSVDPVPSARKQFGLDRQARVSPSLGPVVPRFHHIDWLVQASDALSTSALATDRPSNFTYAGANPISYTDRTGGVRVPSGLIKNLLRLLRNLFRNDAPQQCPAPAPCPPCKLIDGTIVAVGTIAYRWDVLPPGKTQHGITGDHLNLFRANQNPNDCRCFLQPIGAVPPPPKPGWIPIRPFPR